MTATPDNLKLTQKSAVIILALTDVTESWTKKVNAFTIPKNNAERDYDDPKNVTNFIDLGLKAEHRLTFDCYISSSMSNRDSDDSKNYLGATITDATDMKDVLETMFFVGDTFTANWNGTDYECNSEKFDIKWSANDKDTITSYSIKFTAIVGRDY